MKNDSILKTPKCCSEDCEIDIDFSEEEISKLSRRSFISKLGTTIPSLFLLKNALGAGGLEKVKLAFCGQLLCVVPYEVTRHYGHFEKHGLDVELIYTRGGGNAVRALIGNSVDYAASSLDAALSAFSKGAPITRFMTTGQLPLFALVTSPQQKNKIKNPLDLLGKTVGISKIGNSDHALILYLVKKAGGDPKKIKFATLGTNLYEALLQEHVQAGMVQEPALTLIKEKGGKTIVNFMHRDDAGDTLGGNYEFMGVAVHNDRIKEKEEQLKKLARALKDGLNATLTLPVNKLVDALPQSLIAGGNREVFEKVLEDNRASLYPKQVGIDLDANNRTVKANILSGRLKSSFKVDNLLRTDLI